MPVRLRIVEAYYPVEAFGARAGSPEADRISEAMAAYGLDLSRGGVATDGVGKVILTIGATTVTEDLIDVLRHAHPIEEASEDDGRAPHERFVDEVHRALIAIGTQRGWNVDALHAVREATARQDYRFFGTWGRSTRNPSRTCSVGIGWHTTDRTVLTFMVTEKGRETRRIPILESPIGHARIAAAMGRLAWKDDGHVLLWHRNGTSHWNLDIGTDTVRFVPGGRNERLPDMPRRPEG